MKVRTINSIGYGNMEEDLYMITGDLGIEPKR
jgi:hypothetical protein